MYIGMHYVYNTQVHDHRFSALYELFGYMLYIYAYIGNMHMSVFCSTDFTVQNNLLLRSLFWWMVICSTVFPLLKPLTLEYYFIKFAKYIFKAKLPNISFASNELSCTVFCPKPTLSIFAFVDWGSLSALSRACAADSFSSLAFR